MVERWCREFGFGSNSTQLKQLSVEQLTDKIDAYGCTLLHWLCFEGCLELIQHYKQQNYYPINRKDNQGNTPFLMAILGGHIDVIEFLYHVKNKEQVNNFGNTPLLLACANGHLGTARWLLQKNALINVSNHDGNTPLHFAVAKEHESLVQQLLIEQGSRVDVKNKQGQYPLDIAVIKRHIPSLRLLFDQSVQSSALRGHKTLLVASIYLNNLSCLTSLITSKAFVSLAQIVDEDGNSLLHNAAECCTDSNILDKLLEQGVGLDQYNNQQQTPLVVACLSRNLLVFTHLLQCGADVMLGEAAAIDIIVRNNLSKFLSVLLEKCSTLKEKYKKIRNCSLTYSVVSAGQLDLLKILDQQNCLEFVVKWHQKLGEGTQGEVMLVEWEGVEWEGKRVVIKSPIENNQQSLVNMQLMKELYVLKKIQHPCLLGLLAEIPSKNWIILPYMEKGSLKKVIKDQQELFLWPQRKQISFQITNGLQHLHNHGILHRDIKAENVLIDGKGNAKLADFGIARIGELSDHTFLNENVSLVGTATYLAPEFYLWLEKKDSGEAPYSEGADVYALGTVFWEIAARELAFLRIIQIGFLPVPSDAPVEYQQLIKFCRDEIVNNRPKVSLVLESLKQLTYKEIEPVFTIIEQQPIIPSKRSFCSVFNNKLTISDQLACITMARKKKSMEENCVFLVIEQLKNSKYAAIGINLVKSTSHEQSSLVKVEIAPIMFDIQPLIPFYFYKSWAVSLQQAQILLNKIKKISNDELSLPLAVSFLGSKKSGSEIWCEQQLVEIGISVEEQPLWLEIELSKIAQFDSNDSSSSQQKQESKEFCLIM